MRIFMNMIFLYITIRCYFFNTSICINCVACYLLHVNDIKNYLPIKFAKKSLKNLIIIKHSSEITYVHTYICNFDYISRISHI